jgi:CheY-like chemotaxis protein
VLAGGIAHDFNNLLTPLLGYASLARLDLPADSPVQQTLGKIEKSTERAAALCQQMLAYAGRNPLAFSDLDLSRLIDDTSQLLRVSTGKKRTLEIDLNRSLPRITADPIQMRQVIMNLVLNAADAIGENAGCITVRTREETLDKTAIPLRFHGREPSPGHYVVLEVEDTGSGMTPEVYARIFEPFFSTKFAGHGLGLAAVLGIIKSHNGAIQVKSEQGKGTLFRLFFPALVAPAKETAAPIPLTGPWRGSGQVLVVDDEPDVRNVLVRALEVSGFTPQIAMDGLEGVEYFKKHASELRLVLLDLTMPRMDGEQAFHEMHRINPNVPVILMSGYSQKLSLERFVDAKPAAFLSKPFDYRVLQSTLRQLPAFQNG